jgi:hydroxyacylglutathione hydrolase
MLKIRQIPVLKDNYTYLIEDETSRKIAVVDTPEAAPIEEALEKEGKSLDFILNTHHHFDHVGGNRPLKARYGCQVVGPQADEERIPGIDIALKDGEVFELGSQTAHVFDVPGHTKGHISFWFKDSQALFCGDTLFSLGCGRLFEGTPQQMWDSLNKFKHLPPDTKVYCAHEYTEANGKFAVSVDPQNARLAQYLKKVAELRKKGLPTIPTDMETEMACNPFLLAESVERFAELRKLKDTF